MLLNQVDLLGQECCPWYFRDSEWSSQSENVICIKMLVDLYLQLLLNKLIYLTRNAVHGTKRLRLLSWTLHKVNSSWWCSHNNPSTWNNRCRWQHIGRELTGLLQVKRKHWIKLVWCKNVIFLMHTRWSCSLCKSVAQCECFPLIHNTFLRAWLHYKVNMIGVNIMVK